MRNFIQKALVASSVATAGVVAVATASFAQVSDTTTVTFEGTVASECTFGTPTEGGLVIDPLDGTILTSDATNGGTPATVELTCTGNSTLQVFAPVALSNPALNLTNPVAEATATFDDGSGQQTISDADGDTALAGPVAAMDIEVNMSADADNAIPSGTYTYDVELAAVAL